MTDAASSVSLYMTLVDIARLAKVQRSVVSMWRLRYRTSATPFPEPLVTVRGEERFDAGEVVDWLERTGRGNNPNVREDCAAFASPKGISAEDDQLVFDGLAALLCLKEISGKSLADLTDHDLLDLADEADPDDEFLLSEISALGQRLRPLSCYADTLANASYHCAAAFEQPMQTRLRGHQAVALRECAHDLAASLARALALDAGLEPAVFVDPTCGGSDLLISLVHQSDEVTNATVMIAGYRDAASRQARRRLRVHGVHCEPLAVDADGAWAVTRAAVHLAQYPSPGRPTMSSEEILSAVDNLVLQMDGSHRAVVIAPASALSDRIRDPQLNELRDVLLRHGSVRAIVRLPKGLIISKPRQALALWVLGPAYGTVPPRDRWTMVADLTDVALDTAAIGDLVSDLVVAMADWPTVMAHAFRFARPAWTRSLLAGGGDLLARRPGFVRSPRVAGSEIAVRIAELTAALADVAGPPVAVGVEPRVQAGEVALRSLTLGEAIATGQLRMIPGNRMDRADLSGGTVRVIGPEELTGTVHPGTRAVDRLVFSARYAAGRYTEAGDVVFCTSPRPAALVDVKGGSVAVAPARVLRIHATPTSGLLPDVLASDINAMPAEARAWRGWPVRQVRVPEKEALADALAAIERQRTHALDRVALLGELTQLVMRGVTSGSLTLTAGIDSGKGH